MSGDTWVRSPPNRLRVASVWLFIAIAVVLIVFPVLWMVGTAFKPAGEYFTNPPTWIATNPTLDHFRQINGSAKGTGSLLNSLLAASLGTVFAMAIGSTAAYGLARLGSRGDSTAIWFLSQRLLPPIAVVIPIFLLINQLHWLDTLQGLVIPYIAINIPYVVWMMRGYFSEVPVAIEESAMTDGCTRWGTFFRVVVPAVRPGLLSTAILVYIFIWSDFLIALFITRTSVSITAPVQVTFYEAAFSIRYGEISALSLLATIPLVIMGFAIQRSFVRGLTLGAVKG